MLMKLTNLVNEVDLHKSQKDACCYESCKYGEKLVDSIFHEKDCITGPGDRDSEEGEK